MIVTKNGRRMFPVMKVSQICTMLPKYFSDQTYCWVIYSCGLIPKVRPKGKIQILILFNFENNQTSSKLTTDMIHFRVQIKFFQILPLELGFSALRLWLKLLPSKLSSGKTSNMFGKKKGDWLSPQTMFKSFSVLNLGWNLHFVPWEQNIWNWV